MAKNSSQRGSGSQVVRPSGNPDIDEAYNIVLEHCNSSLEKFGLNMDLPSFNVVRAPVVAVEATAPVVEPSSMMGKLGSALMSAAAALSRAIFTSPARVKTDRENLDDALVTLESNEDGRLMLAGIRQEMQRKESEVLARPQNDDEMTQWVSGPRAQLRKDCESIAKTKDYLAVLREDDYDDARWVRAPKTQVCENERASTRHGKNR